MEEIIGGSTDSQHSESTEDPGEGVLSLKVKMWRDYKSVRAGGYLKSVNIERIVPLFKKVRREIILPLFNQKGMG